MPASHHAPHLIARLTMRLAASRPGAWLLSRLLPPADMLLRRLAGGRLTLPGLLAGLPTLYLTTTGARTGQPRTVPLIATPVGERLVIIASNWGREKHPAWYANVRANPDVTVQMEGQRRRYRAQVVTGVERERYWQQAAARYPGYQIYRHRAGERQIPVIVLHRRP